MKRFGCSVSFEHNIGVELLLQEVLSPSCSSKRLWDISLPRLPFPPSRLIVLKCSGLRRNIKVSPHFSLSVSPLTPFKCAINQSFHVGDGSHAMRPPRRRRWAFSSGWSLICFACSGQSSYQGNIIRQWGRSCNEKHSDGPRCPEVSVMEGSCLNEVSQ